MNIVAFIFLLTAVAVFAVEWVRSRGKSLIPLGLMLLSLALLLQFVHPAADVIIH